PFGDSGDETAGVIVIAANVTHREIQRKRADQLAAIMVELNHGTNMVDILRTVVRSGVQALKANDGGIYLFSTDNGNYQEVYELWLEENANRYVSIKEMPNIKMAVDTLKPYYFTAGEAEGRETAWFHESGIAGCLVTPLVLQQNCIGLLFLFYIWQELTISEEDKEFAALLADKYALVIDRAHTQLERSRLLISERRARSRAERQAAEMSALLQSLKEGVLVLDATGNIVLRNRMERLITRVDDEQALSIIAYGRFRLLTPDGKPVPPQHLPGNRLLRGETVNDIEYIMEHGDGTRLHVISNGSVVRGEDGQVVLGILVTRDITRVRELEEVREDLIRAVSHDLRN
ncbi:MAG TPA: GAF domain-containing protein, partial [Bacillota bacterium]|nr:GAF domain-containing protein [Bacillota bacterium]